MRGGCSWPEALLAMEATPASDLAMGEDDDDVHRRWILPSEMQRRSLPHKDGESCMRIDGRTLSPLTFLQRHVRESRPVVITGMLEQWRALRQWDLAHLWRHAANTTVKMYVASADAQFETVRKAGEKLANGNTVCPGCEASEHVLIRPAETEVRPSLCVAPHR